MISCKRTSDALDNLMGQQADLSSQLDDLMSQIQDAASQLDGQPADVTAALAALLERTEST